MGAIDDTVLAISVCGSLTVTFRGNSVSLPRRKAKALIAVLALEHPKPQSRDGLCALLWPDVEQAKARSSLRQCLSILRKSLASVSAEPIAARDDQIAIAYAPTTCDLSALNVAQNMLELRQIVDELPRMLMDLGYISDAFELWSLEKRRQATAAAQTGMRTFYNDPVHPPNRRIDIAQAALRLDEMDEQAVRALMQCHADMSNSATALRVYNDFFKMLERDLDAEPSIATQNLAVSIKLSRGHIPTQAPAPVVAHPQPNDIHPAIPRSTSVTTAVLPFDLLGSSPMAEFMQVAVMDQITCHLAAFRAPTVISSNTTRRYLGRTPGPADVGRELQAKYVLTGLMRIDGSDAAISAQLVDSKSEQVLLPNDSETLAWSVPTLTCTRNAEEAVRNGQKTIELSPFDPFLARNEHFLSFAHYTNGDFDRTAEYGLSCYQRHPDFYIGNLRVTIAALCVGGRKAETPNLIERHQKLVPDFSVAELKQKQGLREPADREVFANLLLEAGLPA